MRTVVGLLVLALASTAYADDQADADKLRVEGEAFAKRGLYDQAIGKFKAADMKFPRARHDCQIGLTYLRRDLHAQARIFLDRCKKRARPGDELPAWAADTEKQFTDSVAKAQVTKVTFVIRPSVVANVRVQGFAEDEAFDARDIYFPAGTYKLTLTAGSYRPVEREITVKGAQDSVEVEVDFDAKPVVVEPPPVVPPNPVEPTPQVTTAPPPPDPTLLVQKRRGNGLPFIIAGGAAALIGGVMHLHAYSQTDNLEALEDGLSRSEFDDKYRTYKIEKYGGYALYGVAAISIGIGAYFYSRTEEVPVQVSAAPLDGGGMLTFGWTR